MGVLKLDGSGLPEVRLIYMYAKLRAPSLILCTSLKNMCHIYTSLATHESVVVLHFCVTIWNKGFNIKVEQFV
jgi:hypothetical protein